MPFPPHSLMGRGAGGRGIRVSVILTIYVVSTYIILFEGVLFQTISNYFTTPCFTWCIRCINISSSTISRLISILSISNFG